MRWDDSVKLQNVAVAVERHSPALGTVDSQRYIPGASLMNDSIIRPLCLERSPQLTIAASRRAIVNMIPAANLTTDSHEHVGFVSPSLVRGTMEPVWGCLVIILLCTWNAQRLTVCSTEDSTWSKFARKLGMMTMTIIATRRVSRSELVSMPSSPAWVASRWSTGRGSE